MKLSLTFDTTAQTAKLDASTTTLKAGPYDAEITINFSADPGEVSALQLALATQEANPRTLAYTNTFEAESGTLYTALLDMSDTRLVEFLRARGTATLNVEFTCLRGGRRVPIPNLGVTVQPTALMGAQTTIGGPVYYTDTETDAQIAAAIATALAAGPKFLRAVVGVSGGGSTKLDGIPTIGLGYHEVQFIDATDGFVTYVRTSTTAATSLPGIVRVADYADPANTYAWVKIS